MSVSTLFGTGGQGFFVRNIKPFNQSSNIKNISFSGNPETDPQAVSAGQSFIVGTYTIEAGHTCSSITLTGNLQYNCSLGNPGNIGFKVFEGETLIETKQVAVGGGNEYQNKPFNETLTANLYNTTTTSRTFTLKIFNDTSAGLGGFSVIRLYDNTVQPPTLSNANLTANYSGLTELPTLKYNPDTNEITYE